MKPRIELLKEKRLIGKHLLMSFAENKTQQVWQSFMPYRKEIKNRISDDLFSIRVYDEKINPGVSTEEFEYWAAAEVSIFEFLPENMDKFILKGGLYAVFHYKGLSTDNAIFIYIFGTWLPESDFILDNRPHFEILGEKYKNNDPESEEEIWIPVKPKS